MCARDCECDHVRCVHGGVFYHTFALTLTATSHIHTFTFTPALSLTFTQYFALDKAKLCVQVYSFDGTMCYAFAIEKSVGRLQVKQERAHHTNTFAYVQTCTSAHILNLHTYAPHQHDCTHLHMYKAAHVRARLRTYYIFMQHAHVHTYTHPHMCTQKFDVCSHYTHRKQHIHAHNAPKTPPAGYCAEW